MTPEQFYAWGQVLMDSLPRYWEEDDFMQQYLMALGFEFEVLDRLTRSMNENEITAALGSNLPDDLEPLIASWFVRTANDASLALWEDMFSMAHDSTLARSDRIAGIITKMQIAETPTPAYIRSQLLQYADQVEIVEHFELAPGDINRYSFDVHILHPTGIQDNVVAAINAMVQAIKPAHLHYMILYSELTWAGLGNMTWATLGNTTWKTLTA